MIEKRDWKEWAISVHMLVRRRMNVTLLEDIRFLSLALGGEAGELQNVVKKNWRGSMPLSEMLQKIKEELADVRIYAEILADTINEIDADADMYDLDIACYEKLKAKEEELLEGKKL